MLSDTTIAAVEELIGRYPMSRGALIPALHVVQDAHGGFLTKEDMAEIGDLFNLDPAEVESVASFYTMFFYRPPGKCLIQVCGNIACMMDGGYKVLDHARERLGIGPGEATDDGLFGLMEVECLAACDAAPCVQLNDRHFYRKVTPDSLDRIIDHFQMGGEHPAPGVEDQLVGFQGRPAMQPLEPIERVAPPPSPPSATAPAGQTAQPAKTTAAAILTGGTDLPDVALKAHEDAIVRMEKARVAQEEARKRAVIEEEQAKIRAAEETKARLAKAEADREERMRRERQARLTPPPAAASGAHEGEARREREAELQLVVPTMDAKLEAERGVDVPIAEEAEGPARVSPPRGPVIPESGATFRKIEPGMRIGTAAPKFEVPKEDQYLRPVVDTDTGAATTVPAVDAPADIATSPAVEEVPPSAQPEVQHAPVPDAPASTEFHRAEPLPPAEPTIPGLPEWEHSNPYLRLMGEKTELHRVEGAPSTGRPPVEQEATAPTPSEEEKEGSDG